MVRLRLELAYDGTDYHGWATQPGLRTVQGELQTALDRVLRVAGTSLTVAGRTDAGVHARGQVAHLDVDPAVLRAAAGRSDDPPEQVLVRRLRGVLPADVVVRRVSEAPSGFDARFSALWRRYVYRIADDIATVDPLERHQVVAWRKALDLAAMNRAVPSLLGEHDFAAFCKRREGATTIRTLQELRWKRQPDGVLALEVRADAFCHSMVRALTGCLIAVGEGRRDPVWPASVLQRGVRDPAVTVAPAHGLTLEEVGYPAADALAEQARLTRRLRTLPTERNGT